MRSVIGAFREAVADEIEFDVVLEQRLHSGEHEREASSGADRLLCDAWGAKIRSGRGGGVLMWP